MKLRIMYSKGQVENSSEILWKLLPNNWSPEGCGTGIGHWGAWC